jgi:hypothetical protein
MHPSVVYQTAVEIHLHPVNIEFRIEFTILMCANSNNAYRRCAKAATLPTICDQTQTSSERLLFAYHSSVVLSYRWWTAEA